MCPVKTENLALNVSRAEAGFWRKLAFAAGSRSRGSLQKDLLLAALQRVNKSAARELARIRAAVAAHGARRAVCGVVLLAVFGVATLAGQHHGKDLRVARAMQRAKVKTEQF